MELESTLAALGSPDPRLRLRAAWHLGEGCYAEQQVCDALQGLLSDPDLDVRGTAAEALGRIGSRLGEALAELLRYVERENDPLLRARAVFGIGRSGSNGDEALPLLIRLAKTDQTHAYDSALWALGEIGKKEAEVVALLAAGLSKPYSDQRWVAAKALERFGARAKSAIGALRGCLSDPHLIVRELAGRALEQIAPDERFPEEASREPPDMPMLQELLRTASREGDGERRAQAVFQLGELGPRAGTQATPVLAGILRQADPQLQPAVITALGKVGVGSQEAADLLLEVLEAAAPQLLGSLDWALGLVGPVAAGAMALISRQLGDYPDVLHMHLEIRYHAVWALARLDPGGKHSAVHLVSALRDVDSDVRAIAAENLGYLPQAGGEATEELRQLEKDKHEIVRQRAAWALRRLSP